jgi:hypothetical protein
MGFKKHDYINIKNVDHGSYAVNLKLVGWGATWYITCGGHSARLLNK